MPGWGGGGGGVGGYVGSGHFLGVQNFEFQYFWGFSKKWIFLGIFFWGHQKFGLYLGSDLY